MLCVVVYAWFHKVMAECLEHKACDCTDRQSKGVFGGFVLDMYSNQITECLFLNGFIFSQSHCSEM